MNKIIWTLATILIVTLVASSVFAEETTINNKIFANLTSDNIFLAENWTCPPGFPINCNNGTCCASNNYCTNNGGCCPNNSFSCSDGNCCPNETPLCCGRGKCCPSGKPWVCPSIGKCFATEEEVQANCPDIIQYCQ